MSIKKSPVFAAAGLALLMAASSVLAEIQVTPYGAASYRYRGRLWSVSNDDCSVTTFDHLNMVSWMTGLRAKVDDQLSLQFQIGNDWSAGESVAWDGHNTPQGRKDRTGTGAIDNLYVHLAYARWNPGYLYMDVGVIPLSSNGTLDLLERSLNTGSYNETVYQGWQPQTNNSLMAMRIGVPILTDDIKLTAEAVVSIIDPRTQKITTPLSDSDPPSDPTSFLLMLNIPVAAGDFKVTPELTAVVNRNYNSAREKGDHEIIGGLSAGYKVNDAVSVSFSGGYGMVSNYYSKVGSYGSANNKPQPRENKDVGDDFAMYDNKGLQLGVGTSIKAGPGTFAFDFKYGNSLDDATKATKTATNTNNIYIDPRYTWNVHPKFTIAPRWRVYISTYDKSQPVTMRMENRPELVLGAAF